MPDPKCGSAHAQRQKHGLSIRGHKACETTSLGRVGGVPSRQQAGSERGLIGLREYWSTFSSWITAQTRCYGVFSRVADTILIKVQ